MEKDPDSQTIKNLRKQFNDMIERVPEFVFVWMILYLEKNECPWKDPKVLDDLIDRLMEYQIYRWSDAIPETSGLTRDKKIDITR